jgi:hypothetical protein
MGIEPKTLNNLNILSKIENSKSPSLNVRHNNP